jgi:hypothetical protein
MRGAIPAVGPLRSSRLFNHLAGLAWIMVHARLKAGASRGPMVSVSRPDPLRRGISAFGGVSRAAAGPGRPLEHGLQAEYGRRFGRDFSGVRVHTDHLAAASATALGATAYTLGQSIVFGPGRYSPGTNAGRRLIAHELAHVAQQDTHDGAGRGSASIDPSPSAESDARAAARAADVAGGTGTSRLRAVGGGVIQRQSSDEENKPKTEAQPSPLVPSVPSVPFTRAISGQRVRCSRACPS